LERYVEADLRDGRNICWWLDMSPGGGNWVIQSRVYVSHGDDIHVFDDRLAATLDHLVQQLDQATGDLIETVDRLPALGFLAAEREG
jgi:hypothetical protein